MAIYTTNQVRQMYVMTGNNPATEGGLALESTNDNKQFYLKYHGKGGLIRSDLVTVKNIEYVKQTAASEYNRYLKQAEVVLAENTLVSGQDYVVRVKIKNYMTLSEDPAFLQYGIVHATSTMTSSTFYKKMALSLASNLSRTDTPMVEVYVKTSSNPVLVTRTTKEADLTSTSATGIIIKEVDQTPNWILGKISVKPVNFEVWASEITNTAGDEYIWGTVTYSEDKTKAVLNGTRIADMEYFYMGERGDIYRDVDARNRIYTQYMVNPTQAYHTLDIHYSFTDSNESVQKSEKDILIVSTDASNLTTIKGQIDKLINPSVEAAAE